MTIAHQITRAVTAAADFPFRNNDAVVDVDHRRRLRVHNVVTLGVCALGMPFATWYASVGLWLPALVIVATISAAAVNMAILGRTLNVRIAGMVTSTLFFAFLLADNWFNGGFFQPSFGNMFLAPMVASLLTNTRIGLVFAGLAAIAMTGFWALPSAGIELQPSMASSDFAIQSLFNRLAALFAFIVLTAAVVSQRLFLNRLLGATRDALSSEAERASAVRGRLYKTEQAAAVGALVAQAAHEISNPLTYTIGNLQLAQEALATSPGGPAEAALLREAADGLRRLSMLIRDLGPQAEVASEASIVDVLDAAIKITTREMEARAQLRCEYRDVAVHVSAGQGRLAQVFVNLMVNAAQAIDAGYPESNTILVSARAHEDHVTVRVEDTGSGIPQSIADQIEEPFFTTKPVGEGTGLGLAICRRIVEETGGAMEFEPRLGGGTAVIVTLPCVAVRARPAAGKSGSEPAAVAAPAAEAAATPSRKLRVLVVDDESVIRKLLVRILKNMEVETASDGREALDICRERMFDSIVCDIMMPNLTGMDLYERVIAQQPEMADRFLFVTGGVFTDRAQIFVRKMERQVFEKPIDFKALKARLVAIGVSPSRAVDDGGDHVER